MPIYEAGALRVIKIFRRLGRICIRISFTDLKNVPE
jgi:hypothetical protein